jgi:hypothetical protein
MIHADPSMEGGYDVSASALLPEVSGGRGCTPVGTERFLTNVATGLPRTYQVRAWFEDKCCSGAACSTRSGRLTGAAGSRYVSALRSARVVLVAVWVKPLFLCRCVSHPEGELPWVRITAGRIWFRPINQPEPYVETFALTDSPHRVSCFWVAGALLSAPTRELGRGQCAATIAIISAVAINAPNPKRMEVMVASAPTRTGLTMNEP